MRPTINPQLKNYFCVFIGLTVTALGDTATDLDVTGDLTATGSLFIDGNTASFGTEGAGVGYSLIYTPGSAATVSFSGSASNINWAWYRDTNTLQMRLGARNSLQITNPATGTPSIHLNPSGNTSGAGDYDITSRVFVGEAFRMTDGANRLYVSNGGVHGPSWTSDLGITYAISDASTNGPKKPGLILYNDDTTAGGWSPLLLFSKAESGSSPYKATMAGLAARAPTGTGAGGNWIDGELWFYTSGVSTSGLTPRMVIDSEGRVGVGTTAPSERLDVLGNAKVSGTLTVGGQPVISASGGVFTGGLRINNDDITNGGLTLGSGFASDGANLRLVSNSSPQWNIDNSSGHLRFFTETSAGSDSQVRAAFTPGGRLGINTTYPSGFLEVGTTVGGLDALVLRDATNNANARFYFSSPAGTPADLNIHAGRVIFPGYALRFNRLESPSGGLLGQFTANDFSFVPTVGTVSVGPEASVVGTKAKFNAVLGAHDGNKSAVALLQNAGGIDFLRWQNSDGTILGRITSTGRIGIGTNDPQSRLQVQTNSAGLNFAVGLKNTDGTETGGNAVGMGFLNETASGAWWKAAIVHERKGSWGIGSMHFLVNNQPVGSTTTLADARMSITKDGNIGIGTTTPTERLDVVGNIKLTGNILGATGTPLLRDSASGATLGGSTVIDQITISGTGNLGVGVTPAADAGKIQLASGTTAANGILFGSDTNLYRDAANSLKTDDSLSVMGNVGVGTTAPTAKLDVNGTVKISGDVTIANNAVIRVSPAGDIDMGAFTAGTNPSP